MKKVILLLVSILLISSGHAFAAVPCKINYQGRLIKDNVPVDGTVEMEFKIYDTPEVGTGTELWKSGIVNITVYNGLFRYVLGTDGGDLTSIFQTAGQTLYLEVKVETEILTPREELSAYPYAINSHLLEGQAKEYFLNTSAETQTKQGDIIARSVIEDIRAKVESYDTNKNDVIDMFELLDAIDDYAVHKVSEKVLNVLTYIWSGALSISGLPGSIGVADYNIFGFFSSGTFDLYSAYFKGGKGVKVDGALTVNGNVGIGTTSPQAKLHISGTSGTDGIMFPDETVQTTAAAGFGSWTNKDSQNNTLVVNAVYKVECDGFVCAAAYGSSHGNGSIEGFTDGSNSPTTRRVGSGSGYVDVHWSGITMPVKKNDYWKVTTYRMQTPSISWIPIGSGSCVRQ